MVGDALGGRVGAGVDGEPVGTKVMVGELVGENVFNTLSCDSEK